jgi:hypothetical protein
MARASEQMHAAALCVIGSPCLHTAGIQHPLRPPDPTGITWHAPVPVLFLSFPVSYYRRPVLCCCALYATLHWHTGIYAAIATVAVGFLMSPGAVQQAGRFLYTKPWTSPSKYLLGPPHFPAPITAPVLVTLGAPCRQRAAA